MARRKTLTIKMIKNRNIKVDVESGMINLDDYMKVANEFRADKGYQKITRSILENVKIWTFALFAHNRNAVYIEDFKALNDYYGQEKISEELKEADKEIEKLPKNEDGTMDYEKVLEMGVADSMVKLIDGEVWISCILADEVSPWIEPDYFAQLLWAELTAPKIIRILEVAERFKDSKNLILKKLKDVSKKDLEPYRGWIEKRLQGLRGKKLERNREAIFRSIYEVVMKGKVKTIADIRKHIRDYQVS
jgi:hypothetical protein